MTALYACVPYNLSYLGIHIIRLIMIVCAGRSSDYYQTDVDTDGFISSHSRNTVPGDPEPWNKEVL